MTTTATAEVERERTQPIGMFARMRGLAVASGAYLAGNVVGQGLAVLLFPLYTRYLTPADYGIVGVTTSVTVFLTLAFGLSLHGAVGRLHFEARSEDERRSLYGTVLAFLIVVPATLALSVHIAGKLGTLDVFNSVPYSPYLQYAVGTAYLSVFLQLPVFIYQARQEPGKVLVITILNAVFIAGSLVFFVVALEQGALGFLRGLLVAAAATALVSVGFTARISSRHLSWTWLVAALAFALPLVPHLLGQWVLWLSDRLILDQFVSTKQLGLYSLAYSIGLAASFISLAMAGAFSPEITRALKSDGERTEVPRIGTYWVLALCWSCTAIAMFGAEAVLLLAPSEFHDASEIIPWIAFGYLAFGLYTVLTQGTWFSLKTRMVPLLTLAAGGLNVALNLLLIPMYGIVGAAAATLIAFIALAAMQGALSNRLYRIPWESDRWAKIIVTSLGVFAVGVILRPDPVIARVSFEFLGLVVVFPTVLTMLRFWRPEEIAFVTMRTRSLFQRGARSRKGGPTAARRAHH
jgi:O-antigen/teichoic acid export membrane protein